MPQFKNGFQKAAGWLRCLFETPEGNGSETRESLQPEIFAVAEHEVGTITGVRMVRGGRRSSFPGGSARFMAPSTIACARCTLANHPSNRFCTGCGLPLGAAQPDAEAGSDALDPYEPPDPADPDTEHLTHDLVHRSGYEATPSGHGWRLVVPLHLDRKQAVYVGYAGTDPEQRAILGLVSVSGPASERDARQLLKLNAKTVEGHFAIKVLRGEEYFVFARNVPAELVAQLDAPGLVRRIAEAADSLEDRLSRGRDLY